MHVDSDDLLPLDAVEKLVKAAEKSGADIVDGGFADAASRAARRIKDSQAMPPGKLTLDHKQGIPIFIVNIIAVEPGEYPLLEKHLHCVTSLHLPAQYLLPASHLLALCLL